MNGRLGPCHMSSFSISRFTAVSFAMWKMRTYELLHLHLSYAPIFHIAIDRRVIRDVKKGTSEQLHWPLSYVAIFYIAIDRRVIRDVENGHL